MLQQICERPWLIAKAFGINAPKSIKGIFFPTAPPRQQKACLITSRKSQALCLSPQNLFELIFLPIAQGHLFRFLLPKP
jgi:hypothetical protein